MNKIVFTLIILCTISTGSFSFSMSSWSSSNEWSNKSLQSFLIASRTDETNYLSRLPGDVHTLIARNIHDTFPHDRLAKDALEFIAIHAVCKERNPVSPTRIQYWVQEDSPGLLGIGAWAKRVVATKNGDATVCEYFSSSKRDDIEPLRVEDVDIMNVNTFVSSLRCFVYPLQNEIFTAMDTKYKNSCLPGMRKLPKW